MLTEAQYQEWCSLSWEQRKARFCDGLFYGLAIPCKKTTADGGLLQSEKVLKFNKKALKNIQMEDEKELKRREHEARYNKLLAFYSDPSNIEKELSPFEE